MTGKNDKIYSLNDIKKVILKVGKDVGINSEKGLCWQCPLITELEKKLSEQ